MTKKVWGIILQFPLWILIAAIFISFIIGSFGGFKEVPQELFLKYGPVVWVIVILYLIGRVLARNKSDFPTF